MLLVVDINVVFSALISHGDSSRVFMLNALNKKFKFIAPEFLFVEAGKHTAEIAERSALPLKEAQKDIELIIKQIKFIPEKQYIDKLREAREILKKHEKDVPYLALALKFNCNIFSGDKVLKSIIPNKVNNPKELLEEF